MKKIWMSVFLSLAIILLAFTGIAEDTSEDNAGVILGPGGTNESDSENAESAILGPGGTYEPDTENTESAILGPGGIYNPDEYDEDPNIIGPDGIHDPGFGPALHTYMYVNTDNGGHLNVRKWAGKDATIVGQLNYGDQVLVTAFTTDGSWAKILYGDEIAYVVTRFLSQDPPEPKPEPAPTVAPTAAPYYPPYNPPYYPSPTSGPSIDDLNAQYSSMVVVINAPFTVTAHPVSYGGYVSLYWAPDPASAPLRQCLEGETFTVLAYNNDWLQVRDNTYGYVGYLMRMTAY